MVSAGTGERLLHPGEPKSFFEDFFFFFLLWTAEQERTALRPNIRLLLRVRGASCLTKREIVCSLHENELWPDN